MGNIFVKFDYFCEKFEKRILLLINVSETIFTNNMSNVSHFLHIFSVAVHLSYHDVDEGFINGMLDVMSPKYSGPVNMELNEKLRYPAQLKYDYFQELSKECQQFHLRSEVQAVIVERYLKNIQRIGIETKSDYNNLIRAVMTQLKIPPKLSCEIVRHQLAAFMIQEVSFFHPRMKEYLANLKMSYNAYVMHLYRGQIWADEYMLGALGKMFNIKITIVSPAFDNIWNIFHDSALPDIVLITNGGEFGTKHGVSHFSATKGFEKDWKCVGHHLNVGEVGSRKGFEDGTNYAVDKFNISEKYQILQKAELMATKIDAMCKDLHDLSIKRDQIYKEMQGMKINVEEFKRFERYYVQPVDDKSKQKKTTKKSTSSNVTKSRGGSSVKTVSPPRLPSLDQYKEKIKSAEDDDEEISMTFTELKQWGVSKDPQTPYDFGQEEDIPSVFQPDESKRQTKEPGVVNISDIIKDQPRGLEDIFTKKRPAPEKVESLSKKPNFDINEQPFTHCSGIPVLKNVASFLEQGRAQVHETYKKKSVDVPASQIEFNILDAEYDDEGNIVGVKGKPDIDILIDRDQLDDILQPKEKDVQKESGDQPKQIDVQPVDDDAHKKPAMPTVHKILKSQTTKPEKLIVTIEQDIDTTNTDGPIPKSKRLRTRFYCERCSFETGDKRHLHIHNTRKCPFLRKVERLKCTEEGCGKLFAYENNYRDHMRQHSGIFSYECPKCGKKFDLQNKLAHHKKSC